jgi:hypothetical protein
MGSGLIAGPPRTQSVPARYGGTKHLACRITLASAYRRGENCYIGWAILLGAKYSIMIKAAGSYLVAKASLGDGAVPNLEYESIGVNTTKRASFPNRHKGKPPILILAAFSVSLCNTLGVIAPLSCHRL